MKASRLALAVTAAASLALGGLLVAPAYAATGDVWSGFKVVDVQPAATTQQNTTNQNTRRRRRRKHARRSLT